MFLPDAYFENIYNIDYEFLKKKNYKYIIFDVDNTILSYEEETVSNKARVLFDKLKQMSLCPIILSNSSSKRINKIIDQLDVEGYVFSMKPLKKNYKKIIKKYDKNECIFIGDQIMTDVLGAKRNKMKVILVDRINDKEPLTTKIWRFFEGKIINKFTKKGIFKKKNYYNNL